MAPGPWMVMSPEVTDLMTATLDASLSSRRRPGKRAGAMDGYVV
jgi:hypothetical protein